MAITIFTILLILMVGRFLYMWVTGRVEFDKSNYPIREVRRKR